ncbi:MAG: PilZ domain-containing protein [Bacillota bacterium]|nr:PilZ domain-containing protein [Bacillota bacterium]
MRRPFRPGVSVQIDLSTHGGVPRTAVTQICGARPGSLVLRAPMGENGPVRIDPGTKITLWRYIGAETYLTAVTVLGTEPGAPPLLITTAPRADTNPARRQFFRVPTRLPLASGELVGEIRDLSGNGALVAFSSGSVAAGQTLQVEFTVPGTDTAVSVSGKVARLARERNEDLVGLSFDAMDERTRDVLVRYVSRRQVRLIRQGELGIPWKRL